MAIKKDPLLYLRHLQIENQQRRRVVEVEETKHAQRRSRETGFELYFTGANIDRLRSTSKDPFHPKKQVNNTESPPRKRWNFPPVHPTPSDLASVNSRGSLSEAPTAEDILRMYGELAPKERRKVLGFLRKLEQKQV